MAPCRCERARRRNCESLQNVKVNMTATGRESCEGEVKEHWVWECGGSNAVQFPKHLEHSSHRCSGVAGNVFCWEAVVFLKLPVFGEIGRREADAEETSEEKEGGRGNLQSGKYKKLGK